MAKLFVFDDTCSILHFLLGMATRILACSILWPVALTIIVVYILYQVSEKEDQLAKLGDFIEYITGNIMAELIASSFG